MALMDHRGWSFSSSKSINARGTAKAFAAGDAVFQRTGVNPVLKDAIKQSIASERRGK